MNQPPAHPSARPRRQPGFTLVEILVALTIGLFLMAGLIQLFTNNKQTYRLQDALSRIQENGRFALEMMSKDIRMAGYYGCMRNTASLTNTLNNPTAYFWNFRQAIHGSESTAANTWSPTLDASIETPFAGGNADVITIRSANGLGASILMHGGGTDNVRVPTGSGFAVDDIVVAARCQAAAAFQITGIPTAAAVTGPPAIAAGINLVHAAGGTTPGNASNNLGADLDGGTVVPVSTKSYYIRTGTGGRPSLWLRNGPADPVELVEGVERMQILYGICTGTGETVQVNSYAKADTVTNWDSVCSVRIDLLLASAEDNLVATPQAPVFPADTGNTLTITDRRLRQGFSTTVGIRNRLP